MKSSIKAIKRQNDALRKLNEIAAISSLSPKETLRKALAIGAKYFGVELGIVSHIVGDTYTVDVQSSPAGTLYDGQIFDLGSTYCKTTLETGDVLAITDVTKSKYNGHPCHQEFALISYIGAAITVNNTIYGTINFSSPNPRQLKYDETDDEFMRLLARWAGSFLERQFALDELSLAKKRFEMIFENSAAGMLFIDDTHKITMVNKRFCKMVSYKKDELLGQTIHMLQPPKSSKELLLDITIKASDNFKYKLQKKNGEIIWCEFFGSSLNLQHDQNGVIWSVIDISVQKKLQQQLKQQAITDFLTNLYNKRYFTSRLNEELLRIKRSQNINSSLLMFDLDKFKQINDSYGHIVGDIVLKKFAELVHCLSRQTDTVGRIGGEEFAMLLPDTDKSRAIIIAKRIIDTVRTSQVEAGGVTISFTVSIGITILQPEDIDTNSIFARADKALYKAKTNGRNRYEVA